MRAKRRSIQSTTGERSFTVATDAVTNLPIATRNFAEFINLTPGVVDGNRAGDSASTGGGSNNFMMDGVVDDGARQQPPDGGGQRRVDRAR